MKYHYSLIFSLIFFNFHLFAQNTQQIKPLVIGEVQTINSSILKENRTLNIYLPEGYSPDSTKTYPVIYLLDGSANEDFLHVAGLVQFLTMIDAMPKSIVVGIANVDRRRDFTFPTTVPKDLKDFPTTGKSENFVLFMEKELQPYISKLYKTNASKTIIGQSLGGLLATEALLKKPALFTNYMIISPSLWWNNESLLNEAPKYLQKSVPNGTQVYISVGTEGKQMESDTKKLAALLQQQKNIKVNFLPIPEENHSTILHNALYKGFGFFYPKKN
ncbi:alpha/beta hydrolase [Pedobacter sp. Leaf176]|uniref:alpha/beta hydrolase n=1 Tax=Pedobacter sp. Leaf176 TaxID=1736286 RepID=UPI0006FE4640|nr:alpha/beta hydrolase-fold protein [Pedobacter sp. Leaf176]KQR72486.1 esterase [Pedobacter sp. Leaf176]